MDDLRDKLINDELEAGDRPREDPEPLAETSEPGVSQRALPAFEETYGFRLGSGQLLTLSGGNTAATLRAAAEGTSGVNAAMAYGTDGELAALGLITLCDDKGAQVVYAPAPRIYYPSGVYYTPPPVVYQPAPVYYPAPVYRPAPQPGVSIRFNVPL